MATNDVRKNVCALILRNFLYAGSSALLISVAHLHPEFWFISLIALIPFLTGVVRAGIIESILLGAFLAISYCFVTTDVAAWEAAATVLGKLFCLCVLFILFGIFVNRIVKHIGFNAVFISIFWIPLEYVASHYAYLGSILTFPEADSTLLFRINSLFGLIMVSFFVVLINMLIMLISEYLLNMSWPRIIRLIRTKKDDNTFIYLHEYINRNTLISCFFPRAPPLPLN